MVDLHEVGCDSVVSQLKIDEVSPWRQNDQLVVAGAKLKQVVMRQAVISASVRCPAQSPIYTATQNDLTYHKMRHALQKYFGQSRFTSLHLLHGPPSIYPKFSAAIDCKNRLFIYLFFIKNAFNIFKTMFATIFTARC